LAFLPTLTGGKRTLTIGGTYLQAALVDREVIAGSGIGIADVDILTLILNTGHGLTINGGAHYNVNSTCAVVGPTQ
jgi:hypothetical protein